METKLARIAEIARKRPQERFTGRSRGLVLPGFCRTHFGGIGTWYFPEFVEDISERAAMIHNPGK